MSAAMSTPDGTSPDMRERLIDAALTILQTDGAASLTVRNITRAAGCSTTGIYTYFGGKHGVVEAIFLDGFESFDREVQAGPDDDDMRASGRAYRSWALAHPTQYMVMFGRAVPDYEPSEAAMTRATESFALLAERVRALSPGDDYADRAYHLFATLHGYVMLELAGMGAETLAESDSLFERALDRLAGF